MMKYIFTTLSILLLLSLMSVTLSRAQTHEHGQSAKQAATAVRPETARTIGPQLIKSFNDQPFATKLPDHLWMVVDKNHVMFLHFMKPVGQPDNNLVFVGDGIRGRFCAQDQPDQGQTGYVHFHSISGHTAMKGMPGEGHGGKPGEEGYWLRHIAVGEFDMMGMHFTPGVAPPKFMATPPPKC